MDKEIFNGYKKTLEIGGHRIKPMQSVIITQLEMTPEIETQITSLALNGFIKVFDVQNTTIRDESDTVEEVIEEPVIQVEQEEKPKTKRKTNKNKKQQEEE